MIAPTLETSRMRASFLELLGPSAFS
jgi:hypothetical protein